MASSEGMFAVLIGWRRILFHTMHSINLKKPNFDA